MLDALSKSIFVVEYVNLVGLNRLAWVLYKLIDVILIFPGLTCRNWRAGDLDVSHYFLSICVILRGVICAIVRQSLVFFGGLVVVECILCQDILLQAVFAWLWAVHLAQNNYCKAVEKNVLR